MAQFDVFWTRDGAMVLDCQSDLLSSYNSRVVIPLLEPHPSLPAMARLNPRLKIGEEERQLMTEFMAAVPVTALKGPITSLRHEEYRIKAALDMLISGY